MSAKGELRHGELPRTKSDGNPPGCGALNLLGTEINSLGYQNADGNSELVAGHKRPTDGRGCSCEQEVRPCAATPYEDVPSAWYMGTSMEIKPTPRPATTEREKKALANLANNKPYSERTSPNDHTGDVLDSAAVANQCGGSGS